MANKEEYALQERRMQAQKNKTTLEVTQEELKKLSPELMRGDELACAADLNVSRATIYAYLRGEGRHIDSALKILEFLKNKINARKTALETVIEQ